MGNLPSGYDGLRSDLLDHVIPLDERHLRRLLRDYVRYYHLDRTHDGLGKDTPDRRPIENNPGNGANVISLPRVGSLHHRYVCQQAARLSRPGPALSSRAYGRACLSAAILPDIESIQLVFKTPSAKLY